MLKHAWWSFRTAEQAELYPTGATIGIASICQSGGSAEAWAIAFRIARSKVAASV